MVQDQNIRPGGAEWGCRTSPLLRGPVPVPPPPTPWSSLQPDAQNRPLCGQCRWPRTSIQIMKAARRVSPLLGPPPPRPLPGGGEQPPPCWRGLHTRAGISEAKDGLSTQLWRGAQPHRGQPSQAMGNTRAGLGEPPVLMVVVCTAELTARAASG